MHGVRLTQSSNVSIQIETCSDQLKLWSTKKVKNTTTKKVAPLKIQNNLKLLHMDK